MRYEIIFCLLNSTIFFSNRIIQAQGIDPAEIWDSIKVNTELEIAGSFIDVYTTPTRLPLSDYGWEDGLQISNDGLHLYTLYAPADLLSWFDYINGNPDLPICSTLGNTEFLRSYAQDYGMDLTTNFFGCDTALNIDILYAHRNNLDESFDAWELSNMARPGLIEGGPFPLFSETDPNLVDHFLFTGPGDIWMINNTSSNPSGIEDAVLLPYPINSEIGDFIADNPILKRINYSDTLLLIYEKYVAGFDRDFMYVFSYDDGETWDIPFKMNSINNDGGHIEHPQLFSDATGTYLYYSRNYDIYRSQQSEKNNWDSWINEEAIILKGNALAIGEPSIAPNGDLFFVVAYENMSNPDDHFDIDPWFVKNISVSEISNWNTKPIDVEVYPNPVFENLNILVSKTNYSGNVVIKNCYNQSIFTDHAKNGLLNISALHSGIYFLQINTHELNLNTSFIKL